MADKVVAWLKQAATDINKVLTALGQTIHELAGSKRTLLGALAVAVPLAAQLFPQHKAALDQVVPFAEGVFAVLAVLDTIRPLGVTPGQG